MMIFQNQPALISPASPKLFVKNRLADVTPLNQATQQISRLHGAHHGTTYNLYRGNLRGQNLFAVSAYPEREVIVAGDEINPELLQQFIKSNWDICQNPHVSVGTWFDAQNGLSYIDVSITVPSRSQAIYLAHKHQQIAIFSLAESHEIRLRSH